MLTLALQLSEMKLQIKPLTSEQLPAVVELDQMCFGGLWNIDGYRQELDSPTSDLLGLTIKTDSTSLPTDETLVGVGCLWAILDEAHITILGVAPNYRHQGFGQMLLLAMLRLARQRGLNRATLEVKASNQVALSLYQKYGFKEAGRRRGYYKDTGEDALILWCGALQTAQMEKNWQQWHTEAGDRLLTNGWMMDWDTLTAA